MTFRGVLGPRIEGDFGVEEAAIEACKDFGFELASTSQVSSVPLGK
jgi:hypothetical protein